MPDAFDSVAVTPAVELFMVTKLPAVPDTLKLVTVCVVPAVKVNVAGYDVLDIVVNVLL